MNTCAPWCRTSPSEHEFEARQGVALICGPGHESYATSVGEVRICVERHTEPDGRVHDVLWVEGDEVEVVDARALAMAILRATEVE